MHAQRRHPLRHHAATAIAAAALLGLTACGDETTPPNEAGSAAPSAGSAPSAQSSAKLNVYIDCFNATQERAHKAWERYTSWVKNIETGPTGNESVIYGTYTVSDNALAKCAQPVQDAAVAKPALPDLDAAAKAYSDTVGAWGQVLATADQYYGRENYKDDAMAQGKALHPELVKHYQAYDAATAELSAQLDAENDKLQLAQLSAVEKAEGRKFDYWHMSSMLTAKQLVTLLQADTFDTEAAATKLKAYEEASAGLLAYAKDPKAELPVTFAMMPQAFEELLVAAKQRVRRVRDNTPYSTGEKMNMSNGSGWMVDGSIDRVIREYNELIAASNRLN